uniref:Protein kinase domain-containing protein n=2 Tax=Gossypium raimondii TaxID=29730 RepID=A0A0D2UTM4_GOSRA|nr:hypothetical protein B456_009G250500 [Gossypium raimondii]
MPWSLVLFLLFLFEFRSGIRLAKFLISHIKNKFTAIGCDTYAYVRGSLGHTYSTGCLTFCYNTTDGINGSCFGIGCCQTVIPKGVRGYNVSFNKTFPIILDWTIGNQTCKEAKMHPLNYACKENSACVDAENGPGYLCKCVDGFQGNPYLLYGCQDINECDKLKPCSGTCHNTPGSYYCSCPEGFEELKNATNNYHDSRIVGRGGQGTVYKGILSDGRSVAIKKSIIGDQSQVQQFINEVIVLSQINHRNVVKLLGCCLETQVPLLVYEYVRNGTLFHHLHNAAHASVISWEARLKIATEAAEALSYLHSAASPPIIHRDVKLTNILLDENYIAKVSDFGASRLVPSNKAQITTLVQGTLGYLDPEYFHTSQLTEKSDVYSFGVVLIELLTGLEAISFERPEHERNLCMYFVSVMKEERLLDIIDKRVLNDKSIEQLKEAANLARRCVRLKGEERPTMKEVASELEGLRTTQKHPWGIHDLPDEETEYLLHDSYGCGTSYDGSTSFSVGPDSMKNQVPFDIDGAR